jgi:hypothetical protein
MCQQHAIPYGFTYLVIIYIEIRILIMQGTGHEETNNYYHVETLPKTCYLLLALDTYDTKEQDLTMVEREGQLIED